MRLFVLLIAAVQSIAVSAQPEITLSKTVGGTGVERMKDIIADAEGNLIAVLYADSVDRDSACAYEGGNSDVWFIKMDAAGNILWQHCYGGSDTDDPYQLLRTADGGFVFVAITESSDGDVAFNHGGPDIWLVKTDSLGHMQWQNSIGSSAGDNPYDLNVLSDGSYLLACHTLGSNGDFPLHYGGPFNADPWLVFITASGQVDTALRYGGSDDDYITEVLEMPDGGFQFFGYTESLDFDLQGVPHYGNWDGWIVRIDSNYQIKWQNRWGGNFADGITGAVPLAYGSFLTAGFNSSTDGDFSSNHGGNDVWIMRLDSAGNILTSKLLGGSGNDVMGHRRRIHDAGNGIFTIGARTDSPDGDVGFSYGWSDFWFLSVDTNGNLISSKVSGGSFVDELDANSLIDQSAVLQAGLTSSSDFDIIDFKGAADGWFIKIEGFTVTGTIQAESQTVTIYPNPLHEAFHISTENQTILKNATLGIYSLNGVLQLRQKIRYSDESISVKGLPAGTYQCFITDRHDKKITSLKLMVQ